ncbi:GTP cyclohydrolase II [Colwellia psychrerythraea]|uniref:GTP cyclohydrolase-2 n=1 Tax=Colwellia psychrerythraea (strain 34H / ATCC BAA-681) TaxID=167879 RepID=RIBA_COLP3|nr:GTP cyclohydrolase II [Colwellia psychrerythraea]Q47WV5.1 RecName: Full=GTP cyclohydrolase-2; AltName: Full=GTP cyclohydrolase II [Colwellia psychrerythraea 34H]AAZ28342.1 GTP cyclohydrolase II [Colwellia psychrerythraea 34H]
MSVNFVDSCRLPTHLGEFEMYGFVEESGQEHIMLTYGEITPDKPLLIRLHSECLTGDSLFSMRCDCGYQLETALENIVDAGQGALLYLRQEGRGIGLINKIKAYHLQDDGADTVEANEQLGFAADLRRYTMCKPMLEHFRVNKVKLLTNNPKKVQALKDLGIEVVEQMPIQVGRNQYNHEYLNTKAERMGHMMTHGLLSDLG